MIIHCTKKLLDELNMKQVSEIDEDPLFSWHANLITINRKKTVVFVNNKNRYIIVLYGLTKKDFPKLNELFFQAVKETFKEECMKDEIIEEYLQAAKQIIYEKTKNKSMVARMNKSCDEVHFHASELTLTTKIQSAVSKLSSSFLVGDGKGEYFYPNEQMYSDLGVLTKKPIFGCHAVELKVTLSLENYHVLRNIIVPSHITFRNLHRILQITFGWRDYHLHDFYIFDGEKAIVNLVNDEEAFEYADDDILVFLDTEKKLTDYLPAFKKIKYTYDFGDYWVHNIEVVKLIDDYPNNYPECLSGEGNTPPEDVGGEGGYEEFMEITANPDHPEYEEMIEWAKSQQYKEFDIDEVNKKLKLRLHKL